MAACLFFRFIFLGAIIPALHPWLVPQPAENVWVTLAKSLQQENFCLNTGVAGDPMKSCLVGLPWDIHQFRAVREPVISIDSPYWDLTRNGVKWMQSLEHAPTEPQELDLLGSAKPSVRINFQPLHDWQKIKNTLKLEFNPLGDVSPLNSKLYSRNWCKNATTTLMTTSIWKPRRLPKRVFLICGDRAW